MNGFHEPRHSRREVFRDMLRYLALGAISVMSVGLIARGNAKPAGGKCPLQLGCAKCAGLARCELPRARAARERNVR